MVKLTTGTILKFWSIFLLEFLFFQIFNGVAAALECYDSSYPVPHKKAECGPNMMCYSEYYAVNVSGSIRQYYDRFCVHESDCGFRGIDEKCPSLPQLDPKMQSLFSKNANTAAHFIKYSEFCCCSSNLCNDVNHKRVYDKYGLQITISDNIFSGTSNFDTSILILIVVVLIFW